MLLYVSRNVRNGRKVQVDNFLNVPSIPSLVVCETRMIAVPRLISIISSFCTRSSIKGCYNWISKADVVFSRRNENEFLTKIEKKKAVSMNTELRWHT